MFSRIAVAGGQQGYQKDEERSGKVLHGASDAYGALTQGNLAGYFANFDDIYAFGL